MFAVAVVLILVFIYVRNAYFVGDQYIIGEIVEINSATARMDKFDKTDGAYTGDGEMLYIRFETDGCEFFDEDGKECDPNDITPGSKVKMTSSSSLKTDKYGYTTVYIKKVEVIRRNYN